MSTETTNKKIKIDNGTTFGKTYTDKAVDELLKNVSGNVIPTIVLPSNLTITSAQFNDLIKSPNSFLVFFNNNVSNRIVYNINKELVISFVIISAGENNIIYTDLVYTANQLSPTIKETYTKISKPIFLFNKYSVLVPKDSADNSILPLPADASTSTYVLKAVNGTVQWVKEA